jgi:hypothetical protein
MEITLSKLIKQIAHNRKTRLRQFLQRTSIIQHTSLRKERDALDCVTEHSIY